ncbi:MAG: hypothetical protein ABW022_16965, partial [Actinoplanes sp.]
SGSTVDRSVNTAAGQSGEPADQQLVEASDELRAQTAKVGALGFYYDHATSEFVVVMPRGHGMPNLAVARGAVRVEGSSLSAETVDAVTAAIKARTFHPTAHKYNYGSYVDLVDDVIVLGTNAPAAVLDPLVARFGKAITVRSDGQSGRLRKIDPLPHWGGAGIKDSIATCTSGFAVQNSGVRYMVTAGHCFPQGASVSSSIGGQAWGTNFLHKTFPNPDLAIIGGTSYQGAMYVGGADSLAGSTIVSFGDPVPDYPDYCIGGQTSGERCGHQVAFFGGVLCDSLGCTTDLVVSNGPQMGQGDSGGPVYVYSVGNVQPVHVRGVLVGRAGGQTYWHRYSTVLNSGVSGVPYP